VSHSHTSKTLHVATPGSLGPVTPEEASLLEKLDLGRLPRHIAVIMDGNGRVGAKAPPAADRRTPIGDAIGAHHD